MTTFHRLNALPSKNALGQYVDDFNRVLADAYLMIKGETDPSFTIYATDYHGTELFPLAGSSGVGSALYGEAVLSASKWTASNVIDVTIPLPGRYVIEADIRLLDSDNVEQSTTVTAYLKKGIGTLVPITNSETMIGEVPMTVYGIAAHCSWIVTTTEASEVVELAISASNATILQVLSDNLGRTRMSFRQF